MKWNKYPDNKPAIIDEYLIQDRNGNMWVAYYGDRFYEPADSEIVAWMELPQPYKEESNENT